jgi:hypothetical protein
LATECDEDCDESAGIEALAAWVLHVVQEGPALRPLIIKRRAQPPSTTTVNIPKTPGKCCKDEVQRGVLSWGRGRHFGSSGENSLLGFSGAQGAGGLEGTICSLRHWGQKIM